MRYQMTAEWKAAVQTALDQRAAAGMKPGTRTELGDAIGVRKSTISALLSPKTTASSLVQVVSELLGIPMPIHGAGADAEDLKLFGRLSPEDRAHVMETIRRLLR